MTNKLKQSIWELADQLSFLPENQMAEIITDMIEDLLPLAILDMQDDLMTIDDSKLTSAEFHERRTWGKERYKIEDIIAQRREVLEHIRIAKSSMKPMEINYGSLIMVAQQQAQTNVPVVVHSSTNKDLEDILEKQSSESLMDYGIRHRRAENIIYKIDDSVIDKMSDPIFAKFYSSIERTSRQLSMAHRNEFIFTLKERKDVELPDWKRTVLFVQFPKIKFETADDLWSTLSNETRNEMNTTLKQLPDEEQIAFRNYVENFNVEMDF